MLSVTRNRKYRSNSCQMIKEIKIIQENIKFLYLKMSRAMTASGKVWSRALYLQFLRFASIYVLISCYQTRLQGLHASQLYTTTSREKDSISSICSLVKERFFLEPLRKALESVAWTESLFWQKPCGWQNGVHCLTWAWVLNNHCGRETNQTPGLEAGLVLIPHTQTSRFI